MTLRELLAWATERLQRAALCFAQGTDNARDEAAWLVLHALGEPVERPIADPERVLSARATQRARALIAARVRTRKPAAYLTGSAWFAGLEFRVDERVIVPRSPIAELLAARFRPWCAPSRVRRILELGTGSGCIAIACAKVFAHAQVVAADISAAALAVARDNRRRHAVAARVALVQSDLFAGLAPRPYDLIIANPPYVPSRFVDTLPAELRAEPRLALDGGRSGMDLVARILLQAGAYLREGGTLVMEVGDFVPELEERFPALSIAWPRLERGGRGVGVVTSGELHRLAR